MAADEDALYDAYSKLARGGHAPPPGEFLAGSPEVSAELQRALEKMFRRGARGASEEGKLPFERLGEFRLLRRLGGGGMGIVYVAVQESLGREVALKIIRPELQGSAVATERFRREASALASLRHPSLVTVFGGGEEHGVRFLAMELVPGETLAELLHRDDFATIPIARRVRWIAALARGLQHAHDHGVIHRDVKPANVRITPDDRVRLLDFGLARHDESRGATLTESFAGSPSYAAPEQIQERGAIDARTDVYALGVTLYECLTGRLPFTGETVEQLFHRILTATPVPPRRLVPSLPRDLEVVTLKAFERRPEQRYATAADFADDLDAVLELRPIRGRPPAALERARRLVRRRPVVATAIAMGFLAALLLLFTNLSQRRATERQRHEDAARLVDAARRKLAEYGASRDRFADVQKRVASLRHDLGCQVLTSDEYAQLDANEERLETLRRGWTESYYGVLDLLRQAQSLDPDVGGTDRLRGDVYFQRYREDLDGQDPIEAQVFRDLAARADPERARQLTGEIPLTIQSDPPGAEVYVFRYSELSKLVPAGGPRMVPVPEAAVAPPVAPGTWALRVVTPIGELERDDAIVEIAGAPLEGSVFVAVGAGEVAAGDRLVAVDDFAVTNGWSLEKACAPPSPPPNGNASLRQFEFARGSRRIKLAAESLDALAIVADIPARFAASTRRPPVACRLVRAGELRAATLPAGVDARATATPLFTSPACRIGTTPLADHSFERGDFLLLFVHPDRETVRVAAYVADLAPSITVRLPKRGAAPAGFVYMPRVGTTDPPSFWMSEREVTCSEWRDFLNAPEVRGEVDAAHADIRVPREKTPNREARLFWERGADGVWSWPKDWRADLPIVGITWDDAIAYAEWRTQAAERQGRPIRFALPTQREFVRAAIGELRWLHVYGWRFRPRWSRCCFSQPTAAIGPVLEFPVDESPLGVFDLTGSAFEWLDDWYDQARELRLLAGGAWGQGYADLFQVWGGVGSPSDTSSGESGLRLAAHLPEEPTAEERDH